MVHAGARRRPGVPKRDRACPVGVPKRASQNGNFPKPPGGAGRRQAQTRATNGRRDSAGDGQEACQRAACAKAGRGKKRANGPRVPKRENVPKRGTEVCQNKNPKAGKCTKMGK